MKISLNEVSCHFRKMYRVFNHVYVDLFIAIMVGENLRGQRDCDALGLKFRALSGRGTNNSQYH